MFTEIIFLVLLIVLNGIFAASEIAFLSLDKYKLKQGVKKNNKKSIKIQRLLNDPSAFLATIQIGITLAGFLASAFAAETFADFIVEKLAISNISYTTVKNIVVVIVTIILSYFTLVFGELVPKRFALAYPEKISYAVVGMITILTKVAYPFVWFLTKSTNVVSKIFGIKKQEEEKLTEEEIKKIIITGKDEGAIESGEKDLIFNIFAFNDTEISQIMTKKEDMVMIDVNASTKEKIKLIKKNKYTRYPIYENDKDNIIGILNIKQLLMHYSKTADLDLRKIMFEPFFVNKSEKVDDVFRMMQQNRYSMSIVKNEKDKVVGLVTLEDAIEEVFGNIYDEYDTYEYENDRKKE